MRTIYERMKELPFRKAIWLLPIAFMLHEFEEFDILAWYQHNYDMSSMAALNVESSWVWFIFISLIGYLWTAASLIPKSQRWTAFIILPAGALVLQNALQHVYWLFFFGDFSFGYGILTAIILLIPVVTYLAVRAVREKLVPIWYVVLLVVLIIPGMVATIKAGNTITAQMRRFHEFSIWLTDWVLALWR